MTSSCGRGFFRAALAFLWITAGMFAVLRAALQYTTIGSSSLHQFLPIQASGRDLGTRKQGRVPLNAIGRAPASFDSTGPKYYNSANGADTRSFGRGAAVGGLLAASLVASASQVASLPIVAVAGIAALSIGLIGRDLIGMKKKGMVWSNFKAAQSTQDLGQTVFIFLCFVLIGNVAAAGQQAVLGIAAAAAGVGYAVRQQSPAWFGQSRRQTQFFNPVAWGTSSRAGGASTGYWQPGQPGLNSWQKGWWYSRTK